MSGYFGSFLEFGFKARGLLVCVSTDLFSNFFGKWKLKFKILDGPSAWILRFNLRRGATSYGVQFFIAPHIYEDNSWRLQDYSSKSTTHPWCSQRSTLKTRCWWSSRYSEDNFRSTQNSKACAVRLQRTRGLVRPGATRYLMWHRSIRDIGWGMSCTHTSCRYRRKLLE